MNGRALNDRAIEVSPSSTRILERAAAADILTPFPVIHILAPTNLSQVKTARDPETGLVPPAGSVTSNVVPPVSAVPSPLRPNKRPKTTLPASCTITRPHCKPSTCPLTWVPVNLPRQHVLQLCLARFLSARGTGVAGLTIADTITSLKISLVFDVGRRVPRQH
jgi:hypothetical protein